MSHAWVTTIPAPGHPRSRQGYCRGVPSSLRDSVAFRRPLPSLIHAVELPHPDLPPELEGLTILQISDLHIRRWAPASESLGRLIEAIESVETDLVVFTGDLMDAPGQEQATIQTLQALFDAMRARAGVLAVYGNHDTPLLRRLAPGALPGIRFLDNQFTTIELHAKRLEILGLSFPEDPLSALLRRPAGCPRPFLTLAHHPTCLIACADLALPLVLAGHTHAGQVRVSPTLAPHTSSDVPVHQATGVLRLRSTLMAISRGVGDGVVEGLRINCPRQLPLYTLRRAPLPTPHGLVGAFDDRVVTQVVAW